MKKYRVQYIDLQKQKRSAGRISQCIQQCSVSEACIAFMLLYLFRFLLRVWSTRASSRELEQEGAVHAELVKNVLKRQKKGRAMCEVPRVGVRQSGTTCWCNAPLRISSKSYTRRDCLHPNIVVTGHRTAETIMRG